MFLERLQSGFLLFETPQGFMRVELSLWQRMYLLWTFRNFHELSIRLLNRRQRALVNDLYRSNAGLIAHSHNSLLAIGVVENFVPPRGRTAASPSPKKVRPEKVVAQRAAVPPKRIPVPSLPRVAWSKLVASKLAPSKLATSRLATAVGTLCLFIISAVAWHRVQGIPRSQAHSQPRIQQISPIALPDSPPSAKPAAIAEGPSVTAPPAAPAPLVAAPEADVKPASMAAVPPTPRPRTQIRDVTPVDHLPLSGQDSILASRPPLRFEYPVYPDVRARGVVALTALVDSDGNVSAVRVVSGNRALAAAAVRAVRQWRYRPYLKDGQPVATETNIVISFISDDAISMSFPLSIPATP